MAEIIKINNEPKLIVVEEKYIKNLKVIVENYKKIEEIHKVIKEAILSLCDQAISIAIMGDYGKDNDEIMLRIKELNKILMIYKNE